MFDFYDDIKKNKRRSMYIISAFFVILGVLIYTLMHLSGYGTYAAIVSIPVTLVTTYITYLTSSKTILASVGAYKPTEELVMVENILDGLCIAAGLEKKPEIYIIDSNQINAFAAGLKREDAIICLTTGIINRLSRPELEAVIAHELTHILNYDIRLSMVMSAMAGVIVILGDLITRTLFWGRDNKSENENDNSNMIIILIGIALSIVSGIVTQLLQLMVSRRREYLADAGAVALTRNPQALINALRNISSDTEKLETANGATAQMFFETPNLKERKKISSLFSTHPSIEERIDAIMKLR